MKKFFMICAVALSIAACTNEPEEIFYDTAATTSASGTRSLSNDSIPGDSILHHRHHGCLNDSTRLGGKHGHRHLSDTTAYGRRHGHDILNDSTSFGKRHGHLHPNDSIRGTKPGHGLPNDSIRGTKPGHGLPNDSIRGTKPDKDNGRGHGRGHRK